MAVNMGFVKATVASVIGVIALTTFLLVYYYKSKFSKEFFVITIGIILFVSPVSIAMLFGCKSAKKGNSSTTDTISIISSNSLSMLHCDDPPDFLTTLCIIPDDEDFKQLTPVNREPNGTMNQRINSNENPGEGNALM